MSDDKETIIDALLEELLGGVEPPDLSQRILQAHEAANRAQGRCSSRNKNGNSRPQETELPKVMPSAKETRFKAKKESRHRSALRIWASAAIVLISASVFSIWAIDYVLTQNKANVDVTTKHQPQRDDLALRLREEFDSRPQDEIPAPTPKNPETPLFDDVAEQKMPNKVVAPPEFVREMPLDEAVSDSVVIAYVDRQLKNKWEEKSIRPLGAVSDDEWLARAEYFLLGREESKARNRKRLDREEVVDRMLASDEFAKHWSQKLTNILVGNSPVSDVHSGQLGEYLADALKAGKPFDQLAYELITAVGTNLSASPDFNPATNFLLAHQPRDGRSEQSRKNEIDAEKICQVFLGKQLQCAQCHASKGLEQDQYYEMVAFLTQMRADTIADNYAKLYNDDFAGSDGKSTADAELFFNRSDQVGAVAYPRFFDGRNLETNSGRIADIDRRVELAKMVVGSEEFSRAVINRLWRQVFGSGFTMPVDDMGSHNQVSHPELLERLAKEFRNRKYDIKSALKWMALSTAFDRLQRSQIPVLRDEFSSFAIRTRTFRNIGNPLMQLAESRATGGDLNGVIAQLGPVEGGRKAEKLGEFKLHRDKDKIREQILDEKEGSLIWKLANSPMDDKQKVDHLFLALIGRRPNSQERDNAVSNLRHGSSLLGLQDVAWVLFRSEEFATQH